ncbi:DivIVA domain-containing protein [Carboxydothermus ferrireducens]|uniref:Cell division initiation protein n=1 Tax=Carboxydothermus ferrireducens DSM 11255 TaxID=1119529 RepID=A0ABX2RF73_9THEO|nr:DivIVA domain-containing protein [Carboxydothermus ferrireducens]NYE58751.1 cell division initiation protein [Carboxydothermus ferrireducens DSM 11255]
MQLPVEIRAKEFKRVFRGYEPEAVDNILEMVAQDLEKLLAENQRLKELLEAKEQQLANFKLLEDRINQALIVAEKTAGEIIENAKKEAEIILKTAQNQKGEMISQAKLEVQKIMEEYERLNQEYEKFKREFKALLLSYLDEVGEKDLNTKDRQISQIKPKSVETP